MLKEINICEINILKEYMWNICEIFYKWNVSNTCEIISKKNLLYLLYKVEIRIKTHSLLNQPKINNFLNIDSINKH